MVSILSCGNYRATLRLNSETITVTSCLVHIRCPPFFKCSFLVHGILRNVHEKLSFLLVYHKTGKVHCRRIRFAYARILILQMFRYVFPTGRAIRSVCSSRTATFPWVDGREHQGSMHT